MNSPVAKLFNVHVSQLSTACVCVCVEAWTGMVGGVFGINLWPIKMPAGLISGLCASLSPCVRIREPGRSGVSPSSGPWLVWRMSVPMLSGTSCCFPLNFTSPLAVFQHGGRKGGGQETTKQQAQSEHIQPEGIRASVVIISISIV